MSTFDPEIVDELRELLGDQLNLIASEFEQQLVEQLPLLQTALAQAHFAETTRIAHLLKGSAANLGAFALADAAAGLEKAARAADAATCATCGVELEQVSAATRAELRELAILPPAAPHPQ